MRVDADSSYTPTAFLMLKYFYFFPRSAMVMASEGAVELVSLLSAF